jgi:hypothetical protein
MPAPVARDVARELLAAQFDLLGPAWKNTAQLVRTGFENVWLRPALDAIEAIVRITGYGCDDDDR